MKATTERPADGGHASTVQIERHSRRRQIELGVAVAPRTKVYLDQRFWIILRETMTGERTHPGGVALLSALRRGVGGGALLCPVSAAVFLETMKQPFTSERRLATARLIDELSLGVAMMRPDRVLGTEVHAFVLRALGRTDVHDVSKLVWTKVAYVLGDVYPVMRSLPPELMLDMQVAVFDDLWGRTLVEYVQASGSMPTPPDRYPALSAETNARCREHAHELRSYRGAYDVELRGAVEEVGSVAAAVLADFTAGELGRPLTGEERAQFDKPGRNAVYFGMRRPELRRILRSTHIGVALHAAMRWDKARKYKPNDWYDIQHATAALGYCDVFLTEGPLHHLLAQPQLDLGSVSACQVLSDPEQAAEVVGGLADRAARR